MLCCAVPPLARRWLFSPRVETSVPQLELVTQSNAIREGLRQRRFAGAATASEAHALEESRDSTALLVARRFVRPQYARPAAIIRTTLR